MSNPAVALRLFAATLLLTAIAGCHRAPPQEVPAPEPSASPAPSEPPAPDSSTPGAAPETPPTETPAAPAQPESSPPPPSEPSAVPKPTSNEPAVESMKPAHLASAKISVPVDLRYSFDGEVLANQPTTLHLAAVPRVPGNNLRVTAKPVAGLEVASTPLGVQKASVAGVYRQQLSLTRSGSGPKSLRVLVTMDLAEGTAFGFFSIPLDGTTPQKLDSVKQR